MTRPFSRTALLAAALLAAGTAQARAQDAPVPTHSLVPATLPRWDAGGTIGLLAIATSETRAPWGGWTQKADYRFDLGRYWTPHLKTGVAVSASNAWRDYESELVSSPGMPLAFGYTDVDRRLFTVAPGLTWQFRENAFWHPYVSGGVQVSLLQQHRHREAGTVRIGSVAYPTTPVDERETVALARPFVAGGFKSYISRSVFARTEGRVAFAQDGARRVSFVIGLGIDF